MASSRSLLSSLALVFLLFSLSEARDIWVGGKADSWKNPPSGNEESLNVWSNASRFIISDSLIWKFDPKKDSVLEVTEENYKSCNTSSPIAEYKDGNTKVELNRSGPFYFISGAQGHCDKGQKVRVVVLSQHHHHPRSPPAHSPASSPSPSQAGYDVPAPAPAPAPDSSAHGSRIGFMGAVVVLGGVTGMYLF